MVRRSLTYLQTVTPTPFLKDLLAFLVILYVAGRRTLGQFGIPGLLGTILRDSTKYFLVIFTAHLVITLTILLARVGLTTCLAGRGDANGSI